MLLSDVCLTYVCLLSDAYIGPKSRTERPIETKIGIKVAHVTRGNSSPLSRSKVNLFDGKKGIVCAHILLCFALL